MSLNWFLVSSVSISMPYIAAALGGLLCESAGVTNIALEGMILSGAFFCALGASAYGAAAGLLSAVISGLVFALVFGFFAVKRKTEPVVTGIAVNLLAAGVTRSLLKLYFGSSSNSSRVPVLSTGFGAPFFIACLLLPAAVYVFMYRTTGGLRLRATGDHAEAVRTLGIPPDRYRWAAVLASGALSSVAGAWLVFEQSQFTDGMSGGRGFIALAAVIFGRGRPGRVLAGCLLFGAAEASQIALQGAGTRVPAQFIQVLPFVLTLALLAFSRRAGHPVFEGSGA